MSCTVFALPWALAWIIGAAVAQGVEASRSVNGFDEEGLNITNYQTNNNDIQAPCEEVQVISEKQFLEKSLETPFMDKKILIKTLSEHGIENLRENEFGQIRGKSGEYELTFEKTEADKPYYLTINYLSTTDIETEISSIGSEYAINAQEQSYNHIVEKLQDNNMKIEDEEVYDDNTIVITVNLD